MAAPKRQIHLCRYARSCIYGSSDGSNSHCDYIGKTGRSRVKDGYPIDSAAGKCGAYERIKTKRKGSIYSIKRQRF